ncbi:MAG TPA: hypothetical protein VLX28_26045 [Thermoanaerobaculia bacterium]|nr:hypothetical protein [Thermoanaerobaculia bacterium]
MMLEALPLCQPARRLDLPRKEIDMNNPYVKPGGWTITSWVPDSQPGGDHGVPDHGFQQGSVLLIGLVPGSDGQPDSYSLSWLNSAQFLCSMSGLLETPSIEQQLAGCGQALFGVNPVNCTINLSFNGQEARGWIKADDSDTPTAGGTIAVTANPDPPIGDGCGYRAKRAAGG